MKSDFIFSDGGFEVFHEFALIYLLQYRDRSEEIIAAVFPPHIFNPQATGRYDAVKVGMVIEILPPCVQDSDTADTGSEPFVLDRKLAEGIVCGAIEDGIHNPFISQGERIKFGRDSENDMEIRNGQHFVYPVLYPPQSGIALTPGTMTIST